MQPKTEKLLRPHYRTLKGYVSAGMESDKSAKKTFLNANENPYELPGLDGFNRYPEPQPKALRDGYAALYGTAAERIIMTRGADEAIAVLTKLFCEPEKDSIIICPPTFGMYGVNAATMPAKTVSVPLLEEDGTYKLDVEGILARKGEAKLVFLCSPNNPTGTLFDREDLLAICEGTLGHCMVVMDETYLEFAKADSLINEFDRYSNLLILRTLSKSYSMAGMRMGSLICADAGLAALVREKGLDAYPLPRASIEAALHVMTPEIQQAAKTNIDTLLAERKRIELMLEQSPAVEHVYPSAANFLLVKMKDAKGFFARCAEHDIILRDFSDKPGTENCLRISVGLPEENDKVLALLRDF